MAAAIAQADVSKLFNYYEDTQSSVHDFLNCKGCKAREKYWMKERARVTGIEIDLLNLRFLLSRRRLRAQAKVRVVL